jgi:hypothetical protein
VGVEDRIDAGRVGLQALVQRSLEERLRDQAAEEAKPPGAPFEALGVRDPGDVFGRAAQVAGGDVVADAAPVGITLLHVVAERAQHVCRLGDRALDHV